MPFFFSHFINEVAFSKGMNSFINDFMYLFVLQQIKELTKSDIENDNPIQLLIDNHNSHIQAITNTKENGIVLLSFPLHRLQTLDITAPGAFKGGYDISFND